MTGERASVTFVVSHLAPVLGLERVLLELVDALAPDVDVEVVALGADERDRLVLPGLRVAGAPVRGYRRVVSLWRSHRVARELARSRGPVVAVGAWVAVPWLLVAPSSLARRTVVWEHSLLAENVATNRRLRMLQAVARLVYRRAAVVVAVSQPLAEDVGRLPGVSPVVIPNVFEDTDLQGAAPSEAGRAALVSVGSLTRTKNHAALLAAMQRADAALTLDVLGEGPERARLESLLTTTGLRSRVRLRGMVPRSEVIDALRSARVLVHPARGETFGVAYLEAAALGVPVVAVRNRVAERMVPAYVPGIVTESDPESLARAIEAALDLPPSRDVVDEARRRRARDFARTSVAAAWRELLAGLAAERSM